MRLIGETMPDGRYKAAAVGILAWSDGSYTDWVFVSHVSQHHAVTRLMWMIGCVKGLEGIALTPSFSHIKHKNPLLDPP